MNRAIRQTLTNKLEEMRGKFDLANTDRNDATLTAVIKLIEGA